jgi:hypothetical protein
LPHGCAPQWLPESQASVFLAAARSILKACHLCACAFFGAALGLIVSQRNTGLMLAATDGVLPGTTWLFLALSQFPIYLSPQLLKPIVRRLRCRRLPPPLPKPATHDGQHQLSGDSPQGTTTRTRTGVADITSIARTLAIRIDDSAFGLPR